MHQIRTQLAGQSQTVLIVALPPKLVDETAEPVREAVMTRLPNADGAGVVLDCSEVELINSIGITCLLQVQDQCRRQRAAFLLAAVPAQILGFLQRLKLDRRFPREDSVDEAVGSIDGRG